MVSTETPASWAIDATVAVPYPTSRNWRSATSRTAVRVRRACALRPVESYRRTALTWFVISLHATVAKSKEATMGAVIDRLVDAVNGHDIEGLVSCFTDDYVNETPVHPQRGFTGNDQVRTNWTQIFAGVPDIEAVILRRAESDDLVWTEWEMSGTRSRTVGRSSCVEWSSSGSRAVRSRPHGSMSSRPRTRAGTSMRTPGAW